MSDPLERFLAHFETPPIREGKGYKAICPAHDDHEPSLSIGVGDDGRILLVCRAGCKSADVIAKLGLNWRDLYPNSGRPKKDPEAIYDYVDQSGAVRDQKVRYRPKSFAWRQSPSNWHRSDYRGLYKLRELLAADPSMPVFVVEGEKDVDRLRSLGAVATCSPDGADTKAAPSKKWLDSYTTHFEGRTVYIIADNDEAGQSFARYVSTQISRVASVCLVESLPAVGDKGDVSDYLNKPGNDLAGLLRLFEGLPITETVCEPVAPAVETPAKGTEPCTLDEAHKVVRRWFGPTYDMAAFDTMLAAVAAERLDGDPLWLLFITGSGFTKTETVIPAAGAGAIVTSTIASEGALLSGSSKRERAKDATGGLLRRIGDRGVMVIKDVTTILSMNREARAAVLAALREIYDGKWERNLGTNGGMSLLWQGRIAVIGACTTAWDTAHAVISSMGDRFVIFRLDSTKGRLEAGRQALANVGHEVEMREALQNVVGRVIAGMQLQAITLTEPEQERILAAADLVTRCRTSVEYDYKGDATEAHAPEAPTRFAKQLAQIVRGACAIGMDRGEAMDLAIRCARDSTPPLRLDILRTIQSRSRVRPQDVHEAIDKPWHTVKRQLEALHLLGVLTEEVEPMSETEKRKWWYSFATGVDPTVLFPSPEKSPTRGEGKDEDAPLAQRPGLSLPAQPTFLAMETRLAS